MNGRLARLNFRTRIVVSPNLVANRHRTITHSLRPVALPTGLKGNGAINEAQTRYTSRRVLSVLRSIVVRLVTVVLHIRILIVILVVVARRGVLSINGSQTKSDSSRQKQKRISDLLQCPFGVHKCHPLPPKPALYSMTSVHLEINNPFHCKTLQWKESCT